MIQDGPDGAILDIKVIPRAGNTAIAGIRDKSLLIRLAAAPVEGAANAKLIELLARALKVSKQDVVLVAGLKRRAKRVKVMGLSAAAVKERLGPIVE